MRRTAGWLAMVWLIVLSIAALADSYDDGRALYKEGKFAEAAAKLEQAAKEKPGDARVYWHLNFAYNKLDRHADALNAVKKAGQLDPSHAFASEAGKYEEILNSRLKKVGQTTSTPSTSTGQSTTRSGGTATGLRSDFSAGGVTKRLLDGNVFIERGMSVDGARLERVSQELRPIVVKFAIYNNTAGSSQLDREAHRVRQYLGIDRGYVIVSNRRGVSVSSTQLDRNKLRDLTRQVAPMMETGKYTQGLETLARGLVSTRAKKTAATTNTWIVVVGLIAGVIAIWALVSGAKKKQAMASRKGPIERMKSDVINQMNFLDDNLSLLDSSWAARVREARVSAGTKLDQASALIRNANSVGDLDRANHLLSQALSDCSRGRAFIDQAMSGAPASDAESSTTAPPIIGSPSNAAGGVVDWSAIPSEQRGVCFFCSKPALLSELTPVTVNLSGEQQKVLACPDDLHTIRTGQMPPIRAFNVNGDYVPWYAYDRYDPYNDYYRGGSFLGDLVMLSLINNMFWNWHHPVGWGWGGGWGYGGPAFYADHHYYHDYHSHQAASHGDFERTPSDTGGTDFLGTTGGDFSGDAGGGDYSAGSFGGGDFSGSDAGGIDFGGSSFGGGFDQS